MNIALDYDGTFTSDPWLWLNFISQAQQRHHKVYIVTMRFPSECRDFHPLIQQYGVQVIATGAGQERYAKRKFCENLGINIHVWIDDYPQAVDLNATQIWGSPIAPEGQPVDPKYD